MPLADSLKYSMTQLRRNCDNSIAANQLQQTNCGCPVEKVFCRRARSRPDFHPVQTSMTKVSKPRLRIAPPPASTPVHIAILVVVGMWFNAILLPPSATAASENPRPAEAVVRQMIDSIRKLRTSEDPASRTKLI